VVGSDSCVQCCSVFLRSKVVSDSRTCSGIISRFAPPVLPTVLPACTARPQVYSLAMLEEQLKRAYRTVTEGKFG
jgi:hypothetical protein